MHSDKEVYAAEEMVQFLIDLGPQPPSSTTINTNNAFLDDNNDVNTQTVIYTLLSSKCSEKSRDERVPARLNFTSFQQQPQLSLSQKVSVPFKPIASYHAPGSSEYGGDEGEEEVEEGYGRNGEGGDLHGSIDITSFTEESAIDPAPPYPPHLLPQPSMEGSSAQPRTATAFIERFHLSPSQEDVIDRQAEEKAELPKVAPHAAPKHSIPSVTDHPGGEDGGAEVLTEQEEEQEVQPKVEEGECGKSDQRKSQQQQQRQSSASRKSSIKVTNEAVSTVRHPTGGKLSTVNDHGNDASDVDSDAEQRRQGRQGGAGSTASTDMPSFKKKKKVVPGSSTATAATSSKTEGFGKAKKGATGKRGGIIDSESSGSEYEEVDGGKKRVRSGARRESSSARGKSAGKRGATATDASAETVAKSKRGGEQASSRSFVPTINIATAAVAGAPPSLKRGKDVTEEDKEVPRRDPFDFDEEEELATTSSAKLMPPPPRLSKRSSKKSSSAAVNVTVADTTATAKKRKTVDEDELEYSESEQKQRKRSTRTKKSASDNPHRGGGPSATGAAATEEGAPQSDTSDTAVASKKSDAKDTSLVSTLKRVSSVTKQAHSGLGADLPQTPTPAARSSTAVIVIANGSSSRRSDLGAPTGQAPQREQSEVRERRASISETSKSSRQQVATSLINENKTSQIGNGKGE